MGPRSDDRRRCSPFRPLRWTVPLLGAVQWGRGRDDRGSDEGMVQVHRAFGPEVTLQWGRGPVTAEKCRPKTGAGRSRPAGQMLQWGRGRDDRGGILSG